MGRGAGSGGKVVNEGREIVLSWFDLQCSDVRVMARVKDQVRVRTRRRVPGGEGEEEGLVERR